MRRLAALVLLLTGALPAAAQQATSNLLVLPAIGSAPETGLQFGAIVMRVDRPAADARPTVNQAYFLLTAKHQYQFTVDHDGWSADGVWRHNAKLDFLDYPLPFYGEGANAPANAEEWFTSHTVQLQAKVQRRFADRWYAMAVLRALHTKIGDTKPGGVVASGTLRGAAGGTLVQPGVGLVHDTRDDVIATESGRYLEASFSVADKSIGSDFSTNRILIDGRAFRRVGRGVLAAQAYAELNSRSPSFDQESLVGSGSVLRGYPRGRYRDHRLAAAQLEWRAPIWGPWRYAIFGGVGGIGLSTGNFGSVTLPTYGGGLRFRPFKAERTLLRLDYARGRSGSSGIYISIDEAF